MAEGRARHFFPGANTYMGFYSFYSYILGQEEACKITIIKGGPGVGKSTFMKKIGAEMQKKGFDVEYMHCSSDNNSLDGVVIPALGYAFIDGTSPHIVDPKNPGAVDEILNFGSFWNEAGIKAHKAEILKISAEISSLFSRAYKYLSAANSVYEDSKVVYEKALNSGKINKLYSDLFNELFENRAPAWKEGKLRCLFASAITPEGLVNFLDSILMTNKVYELWGGLGTGEHKLLERLKSAAVERGFYTEAYYCALNPQKLEHLVIPEINTAFTTVNPYHANKSNKRRIIDMNDYLDTDMLYKYENDLLQDQVQVDNLLSVAVATIKRAKALHDRLETYYIPNIDFGAIDNCYEKVMQKLTQDNC